MPRRGGSQWYRDKRDFSQFAKTVCGAPITDRDVTFHHGATKKFQRYADACSECVTRRGSVISSVAAR